MDPAKIGLSPEEMALVESTEFILTKNRIMKKAWLLLEDIQASVTDYVRSNNIDLPSEVSMIAAKISRGENYKELPYLVLDYPRYFTKEDSLAIRTLFWWGNFFSITLHVSGRYKHLIVDNIIASHELFTEYGYYLGISDNEWEHHFGEDNYTEIGSLDFANFERQVRAAKVLRIAHKLPLADWKVAPERLIRYFKELIGLMKDQLPMR